MTDEPLKMLEKLREAAATLEHKIASVARITGKDREEICESSLHAENRFLRAENDILRVKIKENQDLMALVQRQSEMVSLACSDVIDFSSNFSHRLLEDSSLSHLGKSRTCVGNIKSRENVRVR